MPSFLDVLAPSRVPDRDGFNRRAPAEAEDAVRFDLQALLNAHAPPASLTEGMDELARSVFAYGLRDYTQAEMTNDRHREALAQHIREVIERFEPRLVDVVVSARSPSESEALGHGRITKTTLLFEISARLVGPDGEVEARFENRFEWASGTHELAP